MESFISSVHIPQRPGLNILVQPGCVGSVFEFCDAILLGPSFAESTWYMLRDVDEEVIQCERLKSGFESYQTYTLALFIITLGSI